MPVTQDEFRAALSRFPSGVTVVTTVDEGGNLHGITVSAFCSVSLDPPMVLVCIEKIAGSHDALHESRIFVVNVLSEEQADISEHFASTLPNKFDVLNFHTGANGLPVLENIAVSLECRLHSSHDAGDHSIFVGVVENVKIEEAAPLLYFHGEYGSVCK